MKRFTLSISEEMERGIREGTKEMTLGLDPRDSTCDCERILGQAELMCLFAAIASFKTVLVWIFVLRPGVPSV